MDAKNTVLLRSSSNTSNEGKPVKVQRVKSIQDRADWKMLCIIVLLSLLFASSLFIIFLLGRQQGLFMMDKAADTEPKPDYYTTDDARFGNLIWNEEFDELNLSRWQHELTLSGGGNWEFEYYTNNRTNSYVKDGSLYVKPTLTNNTYTSPGFLTSGTIDLWGGDPADVCTSNAFYGCSRTGSSTNALNSVQSARLRTAESYSFTYGRIEIRAQLPKGDWLWPAIWMLPKKNFYAQWPASGEVDIIEARGNDKLMSDGQDIGSNQVGTTIHWGPYFGADEFELTTDSYNLPNGELFSAGYHNWTMDWTPEGFNCSVDGNQYFSVSTGDGYWKKGDFDTKYPNSANIWKYGNKDAPFDKEFFFVIDLAVGGSSGFFPDGSTSTPDINGVPSYEMPWSSTSSSSFSDFWNAVDEWYPTWEPFVNDGESAALKIDYIRIYEYLSS